MKVSVFLPTRKGSQRIKDKNTREFAGIKGGLLKLKLSQLLETESIDEIILSTNDDRTIDVALSFSNDKIKIVQRPEPLCLDSTNLTDLVKYVPTVCSFDNILWTHVTSPFVEKSDYNKAIGDYWNALNSGYDSLMSVKPFLNFLWDEDTKDIVNRKDQGVRWPRTQDLKSLYEIDSAIFLASKDIYQKFNDRVGRNPLLYIQDGYKSLDVDRETDFVMAEVIFNQIHSNKQR